MIYEYTRSERIAWGEMQNRWYLEHGERVPVHICAGCRRPLGTAAALDLIDGCRVHFGEFDCLIRHGEGWRAAATRALEAMGLKPPPLPWELQFTSTGARN